MWTTDNCCLCLPLRLGCLIIGWAQLVFPGISIVVDVIIKFKAHSFANNPFIDAFANTKGFWGDILTNGVQVFMACCLLYGIYLHHKKLIHYYLYVESIIVGMRIVLMVINLVTHVYSHVPLVIGVGVFTWVLLIYWLIVVYSYHQEMADNE